MHEHILSTLKELEKSEELKILYACESGSRAWGFSSVDSDFDVRFIYVKPLAWYLKIDEQEDTLNKMLPQDLDLSGWELRKTLRLLARPNITLLEWIGSPIVYLKNDDFYTKVKQQIPQYFNAKKALYHYLSSANKIIITHLQDQNVNIKKLFYILRYLLAAVWITSKNTMPPTPFNELLIVSDLLPEDKIAYILSILKIKNDSSEKDLLQIPNEIYDWLLEVKQTLETLANRIETNVERVNYNALNQIMQDFTTQV